MTVIVQIIGAPIACKEGVKNSWRDVSKWAANHLKTRFGEVVKVHYFDLFDIDCPTMPNDAQLPLVLINGEVLSSGGKISVPALRRKEERQCLFFGREYFVRAALRRPNDDFLPKILDERRIARVTT